MEHAPSDRSEQVLVLRYLSIHYWDSLGVVLQVHCTEQGSCRRKGKTIREAHVLRTGSGFVECSPVGAACRGCL